MEDKKIYESIRSQTAGKKILLIGSSGNIGSKVLKILLDHGSPASITAFDKNPPKEKEIPPQVTVLSGSQADITSADAVFAAVKGNDTILCAIGVPRFTPPGEKKLTPFEIEENGMQHVVQAAKSAGGINHIIYISALGVARGDKIPSFHLNHLAKRNAENILINSSIAYSILRPSGYFFARRGEYSLRIRGPGDGNHPGGGYRQNRDGDRAAKVQPIVFSLARGLYWEKPWKELSGPCTIAHRRALNSPACC